MDYQTYPPNKGLAQFIQCYWTLKAAREKIPQRQIIVPDGCMEMIFHFGDLYKQYIEDGTAIIQPRCFVIGQLSKPLEIEPTGQTNIFSVRFKYDGFLPFADVDIKAMQNTAVPLNAIFGKDADALENMMTEAGTTSARIKLVENFLEHNIVASDAVTRMVRSTVEVFLAVNGHQRVGNYISSAGMNRRKLERRFLKVIGLSPKQLGRIIRLQAALKMMLAGKYNKLTDLACENDYYDQAHFIKEFKAFTGVTPKEYGGKHLKFSSLFYGTD